MSSVEIYQGALFQEFSLSSLDDMLHRNPVGAKKPGAIFLFRFSHFKRKSGS